MKSVALATLLALLLGLGVVIARDRRLQTSHESATPTADASAESRSTAAPDERMAALEAEIARLTSRISDLEANTPGVLRASAGSSLQVEAMRTEMKSLFAKRDGAGLTFLSRRLAALGEPGYPSIMEIAKLLLEDQKKPEPDFGEFVLDESILGEDAGPLMAWSLSHPDLSPPAYRLLAIDELSDRSDTDAAHLFLAALRVETDPAVVALLCEGIADNMRVGITDEVEAAARSLKSNGKALNSLLNGLNSLGEAVATAALKRLAAPEMPVEVRERAQAIFYLKSPPGTGYMVLGVEPGSIWQAAGIHAGDLIVEADGILLDTVEAAKVVLGGIRKEDTVDLNIFRDGENRTVKVHGSDDRHSGTWVRKPE